MRIFRLILLVILICNPLMTKVIGEKLENQSFLRDLEEQGYCVIPEIFSNPETEMLYERIWHEYIEKAWPDCKMDDRSNWKEAFPIQSIYGIFAGSAGQIQVMWDVRQDARIVNVFSQIWNTDDLIVSMDGLSIMCPPEIREGYFKPWPHVDQGSFKHQGVVYDHNTPPQDFVSESLMRTKPFTVQGQFLFESSFEGDGGFYCIPKSHLRFSEFAPQLESFDELDISREEKWKMRNDFLNEFFDHHKDESGNAYCKKHVTAPRGSLVLWDSRTVHWNQHPSKERPHCELPKVRLVGYVCYVPKARLTLEGKRLRKAAFEQGVSTGHNPATPELKSNKVHIGKEYERYLEDSNYIQPKINLTPLGESLLGF